MGRVQRAILTLLILTGAGVVGGCPWDKDMVDQLPVKPQEAQAPAEPVAAVPIVGGETLPAPTTEAAMFAAKDAAAALPNPVAATAESIARGKYLFELNCLVCHGPDGRGKGQVGQLFDPSPADLNEAYTQDQADGQLFFTLTRGRVAMPAYRDALTHQERWDVINYVKTEFGPK
jgi:mono/diheme cytochrome c family protein